MRTLEEIKEELDKVRAEYEAETSLLYFELKLALASSRCLLSEKEPA